MTLRDLQFRARRVALVTALVALVLTLLYLMSGLVHHLQTEPHDAVDGIGADWWILADGIPGPFTAVSVVPIDARGAFGADAAPIVSARAGVVVGSQESTEIVLVGHEPGHLGRPRISDGRAVSDSGEAVVDSSLEATIGDVIGIGPAEFTVVGMTSDSTVLAGQPLVFVDLGSAQDLTFQSREVTSGFLLTGDRPADVDGFTILSAEEAADDTLGPIESAVSSIDLIRILLWIVTAIVMGAVVYLSALERERDFAVLKAVGASGASLGAGLAVQAVIIALAAAAIGAVMAKLIEPVFPLPVTIPMVSLVTVPIAAVVVGVLSALTGVRRVNRTDPAQAFS